METETLTEAQKKFKFYYETQRWSVAEQRYTILIVGLLHLPMALSLIHIAKTQGRFQYFYSYFIHCHQCRIILLWYYKDTDYIYVQTHGKN